MTYSGRAIVAVPVKDEAERIGPCLRALALQAETAPDAIVLLINNTTDGTAGIVRGLLPVLPVPVDIVEQAMPPNVASAGAARRMAMERAAALCGEAGVLLTTDADGRVGPDWVAANLAHIRNGIDAVAGRAVLDPGDAAAIPLRLHEDDALECAYAAALDEIAARLDPDPWDPWPRHTEHSGASIAVTLDAYRRAGGMPAAPLAEDRRFLTALRTTGARIRHAPEIEVVVSGRTIGRAEGGMADTIRRRLAASDPYLDDALEPAAEHVRRVMLRAQFRSAWAVHGVVRDELIADLAPGLGVSLAVASAAVEAETAEAGWSMVEPSRVLVPARMAARELAEAERVLTALRAGQGARLLTWTE